MQIAAGCRTQVDVVKRVLDRQTRLFQVRDAERMSETESSEDGSDDEETTDAEEEDDAAEPSDKGPTEMPQDEDAMKIDEEEVVLDDGQEEEWGARNIGEYDLEDDFIDDSEILHYFDNITRKTKYSGFYIHKGPLKMMEQASEQKQGRASARKNRSERKSRTENGKQSSPQPEKAKSRQTTNRKTPSRRLSPCREERSAAIDGRPMALDPVAEIPSPQVPAVSGEAINL